jgi:hypothetical protein
VIHSEPVTILGPDAIVDSTPAIYQGQWHFAAIRHQRSEEASTDPIDDAILDALNKQSFSSIRGLESPTGGPSTMIYR